ncbi:hypothetical protein TYRP_023665 [Tyrophagus putrescentiae]|nr:hypothetical protein TYRP_023665 [Tyrophagus putrescentiae]
MLPPGRGNLELLQGQLRRLGRSIANRGCGGRYRRMRSCLLLTSVHSEMERQWSKQNSSTSSTSGDQPQR